MAAAAITLAASLALPAPASAKEESECSCYNDCDAYTLILQYCQAFNDQVPIGYENCPAPGQIVEECEDGLLINVSGGCEVVLEDGCGPIDCEAWCA